MLDRTNKPDRYAVTYAFNGYLRGEYADPVSRIRDIIAELQREEVEIEFLGATLELNGSGQLIRAIVRYEAPTKGTVGRLNCRACLPACGEPQHEEADPTECDDRDVGVASDSESKSSYA